MADFNNYKYRYSKEEISFLDLKVKLKNEDYEYQGLNQKSKVVTVLMNLGK